MRNEKEDAGLPVEDPFNEWAENLPDEIEEEESGISKKAETVSRNGEKAGINEDEGKTKRTTAKAADKVAEPEESVIGKAVKPEIIAEDTEEKMRGSGGSEPDTEEAGSGVPETEESEADGTEETGGGESGRPEGSGTGEPEAEESEADGTEETGDGESGRPEGSGTGEPEAEESETDGTEAEESETDGTEESGENENGESAGQEGSEAGESEAEGSEEEKLNPEAATAGEEDAKKAAVEDPEKIKRRRKLIGIIAGVLAVLTAVGIFVHRHYTEYYQTRFFKGTVINGRDVSKMTVEEVKAGIKDTVSKYSLKIKELDRNEKITAGQIGLEYVDDKKVDKLLKDQEAGKWYLHITGENAFDIHAGTKYDEEKMTATISALECFKEENVTRPQDATLIDENNVFSIQNEVEGNAVNPEKLTQAVTDAVKSGKTSIDIVKDDCYEHPNVYRDDETLKARMDKWNEYMRVNVTYAFGENIETVNGDTVRPNVVDDGTTVDLPMDWVRTLVYDWGQKYDTFGLARLFTTHSGEEVMIEEGGDYGWVTDKDAMIADVTDAILTGAQGERETIFLYTAMGWDNGDLTGTYVEVSISEQHLWCYKDYELVMDTDIVTGLPTPERETVRGCFAVDAKKEDATLGSLDVQGYASPVSFWAPFNGGQGLHDAPWRGEFGGDIYQSNGSHGCVNIPPWNMEAIYNAIEIGNAVVVY